MFDDPAIEIQELTAVIKQDISALNQAITELQFVSANQSQASSSTKQSSDHTATVVDNLKSKLMGETKKFKDVLTMRTESLKTHQSRRQLFSAAGADGRSRDGASTSSSLPWANGGPAKGLFSSKRRSGEPLLPTHLPPSHQQQQQQQLVPGQDSFMASRAEALHSVESTIVELGDIFSKLAEMVQSQGEMAIRIDENMDETLTNVEGAQGALLKYLNRISSNRWLIIKIFFVLIIFLVIFVVFVA
jgi:syntaxin 5